MRLPVMTLLLPLLAASAVAANVSPPAACGYAVLPEPQRVTLGSGDFRFGAGWGLQLTHVAAGDIAAAKAHDLPADNRVFNWKDTTNVQ